MLKILKAEIEYYNLLILLLVILPLCFTIFAENDILLFTNIYFLKKYFWSVLVGLGIYGIVFAIWSSRKKELRERIHALIPVKLKKRSISRWILGISPFIIVGFYIEMHHYFLPEQQVIFIDRINGQLGLMFIALAGVDLVINMWITFESKRYDKKILYSFSIVVGLLVLTFGVIYLVSTSIIKPLGFGGEEIFFFIWGTILSVLATILFSKRKSYLD